MNKPSHSTPVALTIAGSDPSGGAGIQADLRTFERCGVYGMSVLTLLTVQNAYRLTDIRYLDTPFIGRQLDAVLNSSTPAAVKTGALGTCEAIQYLGERAAHFTFPLIVDPVMVSTAGTPLVEQGAVEALSKNLLPHATLVTPNMHEAEALSGKAVKTLSDMKNAARCITKLGTGAVLVKGGHLEGEEAIDVLLYEGQFHTYASRRFHVPVLHGTGCTLSAAVTAELAKGAALTAAVDTAKRYLTHAIEMQAVTS